MARQLSTDRRNAILAAATEMVAEQGLGAATAEIAKRANVPHGSIFTYFETKAAMLNALYLELKSELVAAVSSPPVPEGDVRAEMQHLWVRWTHWGAESPLKRRALAQLSVSDQITEESRQKAYRAAAESVDLIRRASSAGALRHAPPRYVGSVVETLASTTMDFMIDDPEQADHYCDWGFEAMWQAVS